MTNATDQIFPALLAAQREFLHVTKDGTVPLTKAGLSGATAKFATFPDVIEHVRPILNAHGLVLSQPVRPAQGGVCVVTKILHESGQEYGDEGTFIPAAKHDPMGYGSAMSYAKRYGVLSLLGVATDDDDGAAALRGFQEQEAREAAKAAADAIPKVDARQFDILVAIATLASPTTDPAKLAARYRDLPAADYASTLQVGLDHVVKLGKLTSDAADGISAQALGDVPAEQVRALITNASAEAAA